MAQHGIRLATLAAAAATALVAGCEAMIPKERASSSAHVSMDTPTAAATAAIPSPVSRAPVVPVPEPAPPVETYTVVVNDVPVKELLFALARDAALNVDIHPDVEGNVTLNAVDQSLIQILERISNQVDLRYEMRGESIFVGPDRPFLRTYKVDYVNLARNTTNTVKVSTGVISSKEGGAGDSGSGSGGSGGGSTGGANSETSVDSTAVNEFWATITDTVAQMIAGDDPADEELDGAATFDAERNVIPNEEAGLLVVRATSRQHEQIQGYLDTVLLKTKRQVLIEATIVEVELDDGYQAGVDWSRLANTAGFEVMQSVITGGASSFGTLLLSNRQGLDPTASLNYTNGSDVNIAVSLLKSFGTTRVLSSPKVMALNNQTAVLQVVENIVYFEVNANTSQAQTTAVTTFDTTAKTVPVGVILALTAQIDGADQVILNVRPTISRVDRFVPDPNPSLSRDANGNVIPADERVDNLVPQIVVREMESVLRVGSGQIAVLGGLMQDSVNNSTDDVPVLSEIPVIGEAFRFRSTEFSKTELVIFIRPWVIRSPDVRSDLVAYQPFLPENQRTAQPALSDIGEALRQPNETPEQ